MEKANPTKLYQLFEHWFDVRLSSGSALDQLAGTPPMTDSSGKLRLTTAPAAITEPWPMVTPSRIRTPFPIQTSSSSVMPFAVIGCFVMEHPSEQNLCSPVSKLYVQQFCRNYRSSPDPLHRRSYKFGACSSVQIKLVFRIIFWTIAKGARIVLSPMTMRERIWLPTCANAEIRTPLPISIPSRGPVNIAIG